MNGPASDIRQLPPDAVPARPWDVVIAGAGPAGSICARRLAQSGRTVLLLDKERFPRHKICGDLLIADSLALLRHVGLYDRIAALAHHSGAIEVFSPAGHHFAIAGQFLSLQRRRLDCELARAAVEAGAVFAQANVTGVEKTASENLSRVIISGSDRPFTARVVAIASGAVVDTAARLGLVGDPHPSAVAIRYYVTSTHEIRDTIIAYDRSILPGYGWIVPLGPTASDEFLYNIGCGTAYRFVGDSGHHLKRVLATFVEEFLPARGVMAASSSRSRIAGASLRCNLPDIDRAVGDHRLIIGESAGTTYPFTGEGIGKAMETGLLAAESINEALVSGDPRRLGRYRDRLRLLKPRYAGYDTAEKWLGHRRLNDFVARRIARSPFLRHLVGQFMAETTDPGDLFKLRSLLRSFWK